MAPSVHIQLLGDFRFAQGKRLITSLASPRLQSLLTYLLLHREAPQSRQYIAFQLWPDSSEKQARTNLRQLLHHLRAAIPDADEYLQAGTQTLQWRSDAALTLDVAEFESAILRAEGAAGNEAHSALEDAIRWYRGPLLAACYEEWIEPERERLHQLHITALNRLIRLQEEHRDYRGAIENAYRLLQQDDLREVTYRDLMRLHALSGNRARAMKVYEQCEAMLAHELGVEPSPLTRDVYERIRSATFLTKSRTGSHADSSTGRPPLVGRHEEWQRVLAIWRTVEEGEARLLFLEGEAGIGKTRLAEELLRWAAQQGITTARSHCHAAEGRLAYAPVTEWLRAEVFQKALSKLEPIWRTESSRILPELLVDHPEIPPPERMTQSWQRQHFFEALARSVLVAQQPIILMIDDLQWCDGGTLEWLHYLLRFDPAARLLIVGTVRTGDVEPEHPLERLRLDLYRSGRATELHLGPLDADETLQLADAVATQRVQEHRAGYLFQETEGNPLFVVEHVRMGMAEPHESSYEEALPHHFNPAALPPKVHAVITARLSQATSLAREVIALAATVGRTFPFDLLAEASNRNEYELAQALEELAHRRIIDERDDGSYDFSHDKLREVAYDRISLAKRRLLHRGVARALETLHASDLDPVRGQVAVHYDVAGQPDRAVPHYRRAAEIARGVYADQEALTYLNRALVLLEQLPKGRERDERELSLLAAKGPSLARVKGYTATQVGEVYNRARTLCEQMGLTKQLYPVLWGLWTFHIVRAELQKAHELGSLLLRHAHSEEDPALLVVSHFSLGSSLFHLGMLSQAKKHLESAIAHYDRQQHHAHVTFFGPDHSIFALAYLAHTLWHLGFPDQAVEASQEALARARKLSHPFSEAIALDYAAMLHQFRREPDVARERADAAVTLCSERGFSYYHGWATIMQGWTRTQEETLEEGIEEMQRGLEALQDRGAELRRPYYLGLLAEAYRKLGRIDEAIIYLDEAKAAMAKSGDCWMAPELSRLYGELLLEQGNSVHDADSHFREALDQARSQRARSLELRAAMRLAQLQRNQNGEADCRSLLEGVLNEFAEGLDTPDLTEATALLKELS